MYRSHRSPAPQKLGPPDDKILRGGAHLDKRFAGSRGLKTRRAIAESAASVLY